MEVNQALVNIQNDKSKSGKKETVPSSATREVSKSSVGKSKRAGKKKNCVRTRSTARASHHCMPLQRLHDNSASRQALPLDGDIHKQGLLFHIGPN